jgi:hypothetical protein
MDTKNNEYTKNYFQIELLHNFLWASEPVLYGTIY